MIRLIRGGDACVAATSFLAAALLAACTISAGTEPIRAHGMALVATVTPSRISGTDTPAISVALVVRNASDTTAHLTWSRCPSSDPLVVTVYAVGGRVPVWTSSAAYAKIVCTAEALGADVLPGESWEYAKLIPVPDILGDSLSAGRYRLTASAQRLSPGFPGEIDLGDVELSPFLPMGDRATAGSTGAGLVRP